MGVRRFLSRFRPHRSESIDLPSARTSISPEQQESKTSAPAQDSKTSLSCDGAKNFWRDAVQILQQSEDDRKLLQILNNTLQEEAGLKPEQALDDLDAAPEFLLDVVNSRKKLLQEEQWKMRVGETTVEVRSAIEKVAKVVMSAQPFIGALSSVEPHAAIGQACSSMFLSLLLNAVGQPYHLVKGIEYTADILYRFSVVEQMYNEQVNSACGVATARLRVKFEEDVTELYASIIRYQCRALYYMKYSTMRRLGRDVINLDSWEALLAELHEAEDTCTKSLAVLDSEDLTKRIRSLDTLLNGVLDVTSTQALALDTIQREAKETGNIVRLGYDLQRNQKGAEQEKECIRSFSVAAYEEHMNRNPPAVDGTCVWLLDNPQFRNWRDSQDSSLLWVSADPGCGKSVFSKMLVKTLEEGGDSSDPSNPGRTVCYFFFKEDDPIQQLVRHAMLDFHKGGAAYIKESFNRLWEILMNTVSDPTAGEVVCILDALDECEDTSANTGRYGLIDALQTFHSNHVQSSNAQNPRLKVLVTSRPYIDIERRFRSLTRAFPTIRLAGEEESEKISREIDLVIRDNMKRLGEELDLSSSIVQSLERNLLQTKHRTYLWLRLILDVLREQLKTTEKHLLQVIQELPETVEEAYEAMLRRISKRESKRAKRLLGIVVAATRPLTVQEMNIALAIENSSKSSFDLDIEPEEKFRGLVKNICGLFVTVVDSKIYLIHQTARPFLLSTGIDNGASYHWKGSITLKDAHLSLSSTCVDYLLWEDFNSAMAPEDPEHGFLEYAAENWVAHVRQSTIDADSILRTSICRLCDTDSQNFQTWFNLAFPTAQSDEANTNTHPLLLGARIGVDIVVEHALGLPDVSEGQVQNAVQIASQNGHSNVIQRILSSRQTDDLYESLITAISVKSMDCVKILADHGAAKSDHFAGALIRAATYNFSEAIRFFASRGADLDLLLNNCGEMFMRIIYSSDITMLTYLLERGFSPNGPEDVYTTPLAWAASWRNFDVTAVLLKHGADVNCAGCDNRTPISRAVDSSYPLNLPLEHSDEEEVSSVIKLSETSDRMINILLQAGAKVDDLNEAERDAIAAHHERQKGRELLGLGSDQISIILVRFSSELSAVLPKFFTMVLWD
ncbi:hypothetical protein BJX99DRAFT_257116 [Aspergillus californicus]